MERSRSDLRSLVTDEVWDTPGVFDVSNRLRVTGEICPRGGPEDLRW